jgi:uncharacterized surface protein with fasciclin (FAS1) repeats
MEIPMKHFLIGLLTALALQPVAAQASSLTDELKSNTEVSSFYKALQDTGVISEIAGDDNRMLFAPINSQFAKLVPDTGKCLASIECKKALSSLLRNHIVDNVVSLRDIVTYRSGIFSINKHFIPVQQISAYRFRVEGQTILDTTKVDNGVFHVIDGVLAGDYERSLIAAYQQAAEPEVHKSTTTERTTIPDPSCGPDGCPDKAITTTIIKKTVTEVEP